MRVERVQTFGNAECVLPHFAVRQFPFGGSSITEFDIDDDGRTELVGCGATGLWAFPWQGRYDGIKATLRTEPCSAIERLERGELRGLLVAFEDRVEHLSASTAGLGPGLLNAIPLDGESARLATDGAGSIAWGAAGSTGVTVLGPGGRREIATTGAISDVAWGPGGWTWTLPDTWEVVSEDGGAVPVPGADALLTADDGSSWVYGGGVATVLSADSTAAFSVPAEVFDAVRADLDADGCEDAAWASPSGITLQFGTCQTSPPPEVVLSLIHI